MHPIRLQLYTKSNCPLCDKAKAALKQVAEQSLIEIEEIDITTNLGLFTTYKNLIPVLEMEGRRLFVHRIDVKQLKRKLLWQRLRHRFVHQREAREK